ncbi:MAG: class I SAM-dependent methyltransferase [bacterium]|nr:class I SAM-dependent methyltransferase [bacterium]
MKNFNKDLPEGFKEPTDLPDNPEQAVEWQKKNKSWWESHPMRYDWNNDIKYEEFSKDFYNDIDQRFFSNSKEFLPFKKIPFDALIDFENLKTKDVLEIGVGNGSHASLLAQYSKSFTGIDLTEYAIKSTSTRFKEFGLPGTIKRMDAEKLEFKNESFDFVWSWGVIHHSSNTRKILEGITRVLKPGGEAIIMVYYKSLWSYYFVNGFIHGILMGKLFSNQSLHSLNQNLTDGAIARYYTEKDWSQLVSDLFKIKSIKIFGIKAEMFPIPAGKFKNQVMNSVPSALTRYLTNNCKLGTFLVSKLVK